MKKTIILGILLIAVLASVIYIKSNPTLYKTSYHIKKEIEIFGDSKPRYKDVDYTINYKKGDNVIVIVDEDGRVITRKIFKIFGDTLCVPSFYIDYYIFGKTIIETKKYDASKYTYTKEYIYE